MEQGKPTPDWCRKLAREQTALWAATDVMLSACVRAGMRYQKVTPEHPETVGAFVRVFAAKGVTPDLIDRHMDDILALEEFPTPASVIEVVGDSAVPLPSLDLVPVVNDDGMLELTLRDSESPELAECDRARKALAVRQVAESG